MNAQSKVLLFSIFAIYSSQAMETAIQIKPSSLFSRTDVGEFELYHSDNGFTILQDGKEFAIEQHAMDPVLRKMNTKQVEKFQNRGYIQVKKNDQNQFSLTSQVRARGGGLGGAYTGLWLGKLAVHAVAQTTYAIAAGLTFLVCPPAAPVVYYSLQSTFAIPVETASNVVACAAGIAGGAATGPV